METELLTPPKSFGMTDLGKSREKNEDQFLVAEMTRAMSIHEASFSQPTTLFGDQRGHLFIVADGLGGHAGGERASQLAIVSIENFMLNALKWFFNLRGESVLGEFQEALRSADARIFESAARHPELKGMGTTLTMAYVVDGILYTVHAGDSRCYLFRDGALHRLTNDHTVTEELVRAGSLEAKEVEHNPFRNIITNAVGGNAPGVRAEVNKIPLAPNDVILLCSDGLTKMVADPDLAAILAAEKDPRLVCLELVARANAAGGLDNITTVVARFDGKPAQTLAA